MGTTSEKLTYLNTTKGKIKDSINLTGANITNEPFRQYSTKLQDAYVDIINNGTDTLYNNFPKVSGEGTSLTLNNTYQARITSQLKGNTSQSGTPTPTSPIDVNVVSGDNTITISNQSGTDSNTYNIDLPSGMELCKIGTYQDYFYKDSDKWYLYKAIGKVVLNGSESYTSMGWTSSKFAVRTTINNLKIIDSANDDSLLLSNYFVSYSPNELFALTAPNYGIARRINQSDIIIRNDDYTSTTDLKTWISTHIIEVRYPLATPTNTEITYQPLIDQLENLYNAKSKENQTNISQINNDLPFIISASALKKEV